MTNRRTSLYTIRLTDAGPDAPALLDRLQAGLNEQGYAVADYGSSTLSFRTSDDDTALAVAGLASGPIRTTLSTGMGVHRREVQAPAPARCQDHPAYEADYCPACGTARPVGQTTEQALAGNPWTDPHTAILATLADDQTMEAVGLWEKAGAVWQADPEVPNVWGLRRGATTLVVLYLDQADFEADEEALHHGLTCGHTICQAGPCRFTEQAGR